MNRDLRIFFLAIGVPALLLALGGLRLIQFEADHLGETDRAGLEAAAAHAAADVRFQIQEEIDQQLDVLTTATNDVQRILDGLIAAPNYVADAWFEDRPRDFRGPPPRSGIPPPEIARSRHSGEPPPEISRHRSGKRPDFKGTRKGGAADRGPILEASLKKRPPRKPSRAHVEVEPPLPPVHVKGAFGRTICVELDRQYVRTRMREMLRQNGVDDPAKTDPLATIAEIRSIRNDEVLERSSTSPRVPLHGEAALGPQFPDWKICVYRRLGNDAFAADRQRFLLLGGVLLVLLFCSLVGGAIVLLRAVRVARREALQKTDFISNVSHEFKTPLTTICLCAELASGDDLDADERKRALASVQSETERLRRMVMNVLDFSRLEKNRRVYEPTTFDVAELARMVATELAPRFTEHGLQVADGRYCVQADRDAANQILLNLIENAAKYAAEGGPVEVAFAKVGEYVEVRVADRGPGLTPEQMRHVFERFWRADNSTTRETGGNGLGLSISQGLAQGMNGRLAVAARTGGGCVFTLSLRADVETEGGNHV